MAAAKTAPEQGATGAEVAEETTPAREDLRHAQQVEYGTYRAITDIHAGVALAYRAGDAVPVSNVQAHGYEAAGLVEKVSN